MSTKYYVVVEVREMNDDTLLGTGSCCVEDVTPKVIGEAASIAGRYADGKRLREVQAEAKK